MKLVSPLFLALATSSLLMSCSMVNTTETTADLKTEETESPSVYQFPAQDHNDMSTEEYFNGEPPEKNINFYIRGLMQDLVANLQYIDNKTPVVVTSFVFLDGPEDKSSLLGNQISQSLLHEIHKVGIPALDHKVTDYIRVTEDGDFIHTKNFLELSPKLNIKYVFTGNLVKHQGGYLVNARVVGISSKSIVASAQSFIPAPVANALLDSTQMAEESNVTIIQG